MNMITANFDEVLRFAQNYGLPVLKKRAILREYLQTKILSLLYREIVSQRLFFVGGTSLRLLRTLDRFSEDLDFDAPDIPVSTIDALLHSIAKRLQSENISLDIYHNQTPLKHHYEFRFPALLPELRLSQNREEKLAIKFDVEYAWRGQTREVVTLNRYGLLANVVTKTIDQILIEKLVAYVSGTPRPGTSTILSGLEPTEPNRTGHLRQPTAIPRCSSGMRSKNL